MWDAIYKFLGVETPVEFWWVVLGFAAQAMFMMRFVVQWIASEKAKRSVMPVAFWYFSLFGGILLFLYAVHRGDPVFIVGQATGLVIYTRNLWLIHAERRDLRAADARRDESVGARPRPATAGE